MVALGMFSAALKDLAVELNIFVMTATQVNANGEDNNRSIKNESVIRGARSIVDKVDMGCVMCRPTEEELNILSSVSHRVPNVVTDVYKMRRGRYTQVRIWSYVDLGSCRKEDLFVTTGRLEIVEIANLKQEYENDNWSINANIVALNSNTYHIPVDSNGEIVEEREESISKGLFDGLI